MSEWKSISGLDKNNPEDMAIIRELKRFNWGAFCLNWIWGACNGVFDKFIVCFVLWLLLMILIVFYINMYLVMLAFAGFVTAAIYCGMNGNLWAYEAKKVTDFQKFIKVQKNWAKAAAIVLIIIVLFVIASIVYVSYIVSSVFSPSGRGELMLKPLIKTLVKQEKYSTLKTGSDVAAFLLSAQNEDSKNFVPYGATGIKYEKNSAKGRNMAIVFTFYKEEKCSIEEKNCYVYYYESLNGQELQPKSKAYYGDDGKIKIVGIEAKK